MKLNSQGGVLMDAVGLAHGDATIIRNISKDGGAFMRLVDLRGWSDEEAAGYYNSQFGTGGDWLPANVADFRRFLIDSNQYTPKEAAPVKAGTAAGAFTCSCGRKYSVVPD